MAFIDYYTELLGQFPKLPAPLAQTFINRAWQDIRDMRLWSFLVGYGDILTPSIISTGTVSVTLGSTQVTPDAVLAAPAFTAVALSTPPLASPLLGVGRQLRITGTANNGPLYTIIAWDGAIATLDRPYASATNAAATYQVYKAYYAPPSTDFIRYITIDNTLSGYSMRQRQLYRTQAQLNAVDAVRGATGDAYLIAAWRNDSTGAPVHEWYPHPTNASLYTCYYQRRGVPLSATQDLPATLPSSLLMARALIHASDWASGVIGMYPELAQVNWQLYRMAKEKQFKETLIRCIRQDDEIFPRVPFMQGQQYSDFPPGGAFLQGHDTGNIWGR